MLLSCESVHKPLPNFITCTYETNYFEECIGHSFAYNKSAWKWGKIQQKDKNKQINIFFLTLIQLIKNIIKKSLDL